MIKKEALKLADYLLEVSTTEDSVDVELFNGSALIRHLVKEFEIQEKALQAFKDGKKSKSLAYMANILGSGK